MIALLRVAAIAAAGATLYFVGVVNSAVLLYPSRQGAVAVTAGLAAALVVLVLALVGTGRGEGAGVGPAIQRRAHRLAWAFVTLMALVGLAWLTGVPRARSHDWTPYHNDAIAINECAAKLVLDGRNPYSELDLMRCYAERELGPDRTTPLRRGPFADIVVYPTDAELDAAWSAAIERCAVPAVGAEGRGIETGSPVALRGGPSGVASVPVVGAPASEARAPTPGTPAPAHCETPEFVWRPSYPALSFLLIVPWVALGWDTNFLYVGCLLAAMAVVLVRAGPGLRPFVLTALLGATSLAAFTVGGSGDLLYALPVAAAWLWRERRWSALALGIAVAAKQLAWFFAPFYLMQVAARSGWREAARRAGVAAAVFAVANLPFVIADPLAWYLGMVTPVTEPMFPRGAGLVFLSTNGVIPLWPASAYLVVEAAAGIGVVLLAWRTRHSSPELGAVLPMIPLFFAWRSLFSYFFLLPLFALAAVVRMPIGPVVPDVARASGAFTVFAAPRSL